MARMIATVLVVLAFLGGFLGSIHGLGDSLAVFRVLFSGLLLALALFWAGRRVVRVSLSALAILGLGSVFWHKLPAGSPGPKVIYQKNLLHSNDNLPGVADDILATDADFVTLQEVSIANEALLERLKPVYPHQHLCRYTQRSGIAILSRIAPVDEGECGKAAGFAMLSFLDDDGPFTVMSLHLTWPFPRQQARQVTRLTPVLQGIDGPVLIGGDFNMVPWSHALRQIARASGSERAGPALASFLLGSLPVAIDHVFAPHGGRAEARPLLGADHFGILARVHLRDPENAN
ncbi:MAG: endonuclease/exonuclease/phosphatase family protein [Pseudomonadota bacterium]